MRYEFCYSPGTDFLLGRSSELVAPLGRETTSNYQVRYRALLVERGQWTALAAPGDSWVAVVVRPAGDRRPAPIGGIEFFRDARFRAYRMPPAVGGGRGAVGTVSASGGR